MEKRKKKKQAKGLERWQKPLEELCCVNPQCPLCEKKGGGNLSIRMGKSNGKWRILRCKACRKEFSERKGTAMYKSHLPPEKFVEIAEHLKEGVGIMATARLCRTRPATVRLVGLRAGIQARALHEKKVRNLKVHEAQFDEKWSYVGKKRETPKPA